MNSAAYLKMAETESKHWWFSGRRTILASIIAGLNLSQKPNILEIGCGTGGNLEMLGKFGKVSALEMNEIARAIASKKTSMRYDIRDGYCPDKIPFTGKRFDLICLLDVLEHIEKDTETLLAAKNLLKKNGRILITVPAYQWLYSAHDEFLHHKRRYTATQLQKKIAIAGLKSSNISYFNTILFPIAVIARLKDKLLGNASTADSNIPPAILNSIFQKIFEFERILLANFRLPFGISLLCVLEATDES